MLNEAAAENNALSAPPQRRRLKYIDSLKGFAILCVVLGHVTDGYLSAGMYPSSKSMPIVHEVLYSFHMALFMIISGYLYYMAYFDEGGKPKKGRLYRQTLNLTVMYIVFSVAFGLFKVLCGRFTNAKTSISDILLIAFKPISPYWYLYILIFYYLIFSVKRLCRADNRLILAVSVVVSLLSFFVSTSLFELHRFMYFIFFFYLGIMCRKNNGGFFENGAAAAIMFLVGATLLLLTLTDTIGDVMGASMIIALGISQALWCAFKKLKPLGENRLLELCGRYCLEIYVLHCVFTSGARAVFPDFILNNYALSVALNFVISTAVPILFSLVCKKLNIHGLFFKPVTYLSERKSRRGVENAL